MTVCCQPLPLSPQLGTGKVPVLLLYSSSLSHLLFPEAGLLGFLILSSRIFMCFLLCLSNYQKYLFLDYYLTGISVSVVGESRCFFLQCLMLAISPRALPASINKHIISMYSTIIRTSGVEKSKKTNSSMRNM